MGRRNPILREQVATPTSRAARTTGRITRGDDLSLGTVDPIFGPFAHSNVGRTLALWPDVVHGSIMSSYTGRQS
jgi:hypothetical protein